MSEITRPLIRTRDDFMPILRCKGVHRPTILGKIAPDGSLQIRTRSNIGKFTINLVKGSLTCPKCHTTVSWDATASENGQAIGGDDANSSGT